MESYDVHSRSTDPVRPRNRGFHRAILAMYIVTVAVLFAATIIVGLTIHSSAFYWPILLLGAVIISILISGAVIPHLRDRSPDPSPRIRRERHAHRAHHSMG